MRFYAPLAKIDAAEHMVWGYASTEAEDDQGEIVTRDALAAALADYLKFANIREMHQMSAVGIAEEAAIDDKGLYVGARIVDPRAWNKVAAGVYKGFSIGGRVKSRDPADRTIITALSLTEISLVDRPANPEAVFDCWKAEGAKIMADAAAAERQPVQLWHCGVAAHRHLVKADAMRCLEKRAEPGEDEVDTAEYADPGYQADGQRRYPIDSEAHVRAAWAYIHQPDNAARYNPAELAHIKARIRAAWQDKVDPAGPPGSAIGANGKAMPGGDLGQNPPEIGRIGEIIGHLEWLCGFLHGIAGGVPAPQLAGTDLDGDKAARAGDLAKALAGEIVPRLDALARRVEDIAQTPLPPQTAARSYAGIAKREDGGGFADDVVGALSRMSEEERTLALIKAAHANPVTPFGRPAGISRG